MQNVFSDHARLDSFKTLGLLLEINEKHCITNYYANNGNPLHAELLDLQKLFLCFMDPPQQPCEEAGKTPKTSDVPTTNATHDQVKGLSMVVSQGLRTVGGSNRQEPLLHGVQYLSIIFALNSEHEQSLHSI
jgi:hypothetical protein